MNHDSEWDDGPPLASYDEEPDAMAFNNTPRQTGKTPYKHKTNRGSMFDNDRKTKETQPDFTGSLDVEGTIYWISGWAEMTPQGKRKLSLAINIQHERQAEPTQTPAARRGPAPKW